jgi:hypothetical protein
MLNWKNWVAKWANNEVTHGTPRRCHVARPRGHHVASLQHDRWHLHDMMTVQKHQMVGFQVAQSPSATWHPLDA